VTIKIAILFAAAAALAPAAASAQPAAPAYPSKQVRMVVGLPPGGSNDILARAVAQGISVAWGQPVIVEIRPGANGILAINQVLKAPPDGYTLLVGAQSGYSINPFAYDKLSYDPARDLAPITMFGNIAVLVVVHPSVQAKSVRELIALAKSRPGELNYGTPAISFHVVAETLSQRAGIRLTRIPYKGSVPTVTALLAGDIQIGFVDPAPVLPHIKSGRVRVLAITSGQRARYLPEVPTVAEDGVPEFDERIWIGLFARGGTPREIIDRVYAEAARTLQAPELRARLADLGIDPVANSPEAFAAYLRAESARFGPIIKAANIRAE